ncbi:hypothetical protein Dsin_029265 [Dipteronia sinensis]|uniref:Reverse transcriptase zinc-binding domain-containing protein n=1 Tax=Dipteronia sinensis TaxID=43782 RepID=A0AAD9ZSQ9_9ROSI|nr:hypothetical protein Dsin_029265 [Dipteronia sinensis]
MGLVKGAVLGDDKLHISHLQFADDTVLFLQPRADYLANARRIMICFELASGLRLNLQKSCVVRVGKVRGSEVEWGTIFRCAQGSLPLTYLGLPLGGRPSARSFWNELVCRVERRLAPWKKSFLNKGGRLVLIKTVMASIPIYYMSMFKISDGIQNKKIHPIRWEVLCKNKRNFGLGVGAILHKNNSLLAKWVWRFGTEVAPLWKRAICAKYGVSKDFLRWEWMCGSNCSSFTKAVGALFAQGSDSAKILEEGIKMVVGRGDKARLWEDVLVEGNKLKVAFPRIFTLAVNKTGCIREFWSKEGETSKWEIPLPRTLFDWKIEQWRCFKVCLESLSIVDNVQDTIGWSHDPTGSFTVKSFWRCYEGGNARGQSNFTGVWQGVCPPKIEVFVWHLLHGRTLVKDVLHRLGSQVDSNVRCPICQESEESIDHLFLSCKWANSLWHRCMKWWDVSVCLPRSLKEWWESWMELCYQKNSERAWRSLFFAVTWSIWEARNHKVFKDGAHNIHVAQYCYVLYRGEKKKLPSSGEWIPPPADALKFNVDGSAWGASGSAGIGGIRDAIDAEVRAIARACELCVSKTELAGKEVIIVSDSQLAVTWINNAGVGNIEHAQTIYGI